jgi:hypothetical protein
MGTAEHERGSGTVLVIGLVAVVLVLGAALGALGRVQGARSGARTAADLGALAAASAIAVPDGITLAAPAAPGRADGGPCALAAEVVERNGARLSGCMHLGSGVVQVTATRPTVIGPASATARAGPSSARGP